MDDDAVEDVLDVVDNRLLFIFSRVFVKLFNLLFVKCSIIESLFSLVSIKSLLLISFCSILMPLTVFKRVNNLKPLLWLLLLFVLL